jgi:hypothetical protein
VDTFSVLLLGHPKGARLFLVSGVNPIWDEARGMELGREGGKHIARKF